MTGRDTRVHEFRVTIEAASIRAKWGPLGQLEQGSTQVEDWAVDELSLRTALLFESWLNLWNRIEGIQGAGIILKPETVRLIGEHLWNLILTDSNGALNDVGRALRAQVSAATSEPLYVLIDLGSKADPGLKKLPWEFLYDPESQQYLATRENLVFTRFVPPRDGRKPIEASRSKLRVLFLNLLPGQASQDVVNEIEQLQQALNTQLNKTLEVTEILRGLDGSEEDEEGRPTSLIARALRGERRCQVVHVFGVCRGAPGDPKIWLPNAKDYGDPEPLVSALTTGATPPPLVILHLADWSAGDAEDNFERLAPLLIERGVPAVLAMQYPVPTAANKEALIELYRELSGKDLLGVAVQASRRRALKLADARQVGAPVLYLQTDGILLAPTPVAPAPSPSTAFGPGRGPSLPPTAITEAGIRKALLDELDSGFYEEEWVDKYRDWIVDAELSNEIEVARERLKSFVRRGQFGPDKPVVDINIGLMKKLNLLGGGDDARIPPPERPEPSGPRGFVKRRP